MKRCITPPLNYHGQTLVPCANVACDRWVSPSVADPYCCTGCRLADEGEHEIHELLGHSKSCNDKKKERGTQYERPRT